MARMSGISVTPETLEAIRRWQATAGYAVGRRVNQSAALAIALHLASGHTVEEVAAAAAEITPIGEAQ